MLQVARFLELRASRLQFHQFFRALFQRLLILGDLALQGAQFDFRLPQLLLQLVVAKAGGGDFPRNTLDILLKLLQLLARNFRVGLRQALRCKGGKQQPR